MALNEIAQAFWRESDKKRNAHPPGADIPVVQVHDVTPLEKRLNEEQGAKIEWVLRENQLLWNFVYWLERNSPQMGDAFGSSFDVQRRQLYQLKVGLAAAEKDPKCQ